MSPIERRRSEGLIDLSSRRRVHVVGAGGPGMSALALLLCRLGHEVTGSDVRESEVTRQLSAEGARVFLGHDASRVGGADVVVYSTAVPADNVELAAARRSGIPVRHRADLLASICALFRSVGIAGTHGKTTTTALLDHGLAAVGFAPSAIIGAEVLGSGIGATHRGGGLLLIEADESDGTLDVLGLDALLVTNLDTDHLDYFGSFEAMRDSFADRVREVEGPIVLNADDPASAPLLEVARGRARTFGRGEGSDVRILRADPVHDGLTIELDVDGATIGTVVGLRGIHNAMNVAAATAMATELGADPGEFLASLADFPGVARRFTERGTAKGALLVDDYAHLPAEIEATVAAMRSHPAVTGRVVAVFQPNRYHRVQAMADEYANCFAGADSVVITEIYPSGTTPIPGVSGRMVFDAIVAAHPGADVAWAPSRADVLSAVLDRLAPGDGCVSMGCGDIESFPDELAAACG